MFDDRELIQSSVSRHSTIMESAGCNKRVFSWSYNCVLLENLVSVAWLDQETGKQTAHWLWVTQKVDEPNSLLCRTGNNRQPLSAIVDCSFFPSFCPLLLLFHYLNFSLSLSVSLSLPFENASFTCSALELVNAICRFLKLWLFQFKKKKEVLIENG